MNLIPDETTLAGTANGEETNPTSRFRILNQQDRGRCATFEFLEEDHTLGNALRHMILKNPNVKFCGYALPHPNERKINFQIQVYEGEALDALEKGLSDLISLNSIVKKNLEQAAKEFGPVELIDSEDDDEDYPEIVRADNQSK